MTATLDPSRRAQLEQTGLRPFPRGEHQHQLADLNQLEEHPRYRFRSLSSRDEALALAITSFRDPIRGRVLWVVNQVARCQALARELHERLGHPVFCFHSRFCLKDRKDRHRETVAAFQQRDRAAIAVTTQVCEMSLDLDADVLITEEAPISSLVQRFGRANRKLHGKEVGFRGHLYAYQAEHELPYTRDEIAAARRFLASLGEGDLSQRRLAELLAEHERERPTPDGFALFLRQGYYATPDSFRDIDGHTLPCVLDRDLDQVKEAWAKKRPLDQFVVPVPGRAAKPAAKELGLPPYLFVAPESCYSAEFGFELPTGGVP